MNKPYPCSDCCDNDPPCNDCLDDISPITVDLKLAGMADLSCTGAAGLDDTYTLTTDGACSWSTVLDITGDGIKVTDVCTAATQLSIILKFVGSLLQATIRIEDSGGTVFEFATYEYTSATPDEPCCTWSSQTLNFAGTSSSGNVGNDWTAATVDVTTNPSCMPCPRCTGESPYEFSVVLSNDFASGSCTTAECTPHSGTYIVQKTSYFSNVGCLWSGESTIAGRHTGWGLEPVVPDQCHDADKVEAFLYISIPEGFMSFGLKIHLKGFSNNYLWRITSPPYDCMNLSGFDLDFVNATTTLGGSKLYPGFGCDASAVTCKVTTA